MSEENQKRRRENTIIITEAEGEEGTGGRKDRKK
jgi:hypothetical protein